jgi:hypothetical protein
MDEMMPNQAANKEKAEGSRENVNLGDHGGKLDHSNGAENPMERGSGQVSQPNKSQGSAKDRKGRQDEAGGITNRPLSEEQREEEQLPPRGETKHGGHAG